MNWGAWIGLIGGGIGFIIGAVAAISADPVFGTVFFALFGGIFFSVYWFFLRPIFGGNKILKTGVQKQASIIDYADSGVTVNNNPQVRFTLELKDDHNRPYQVKTNKIISRLDVGKFYAGMPVVVRVDQNNNMKVVIESFGNLADNSGSPNTTSPSANTMESEWQKILMQNEELNKKIQYTGIPAEAKIISATDLGPRVNGDNPFMQFYLEVHPGLKEVFYAEAKGVISNASLPKYQPGKTIYVKYLADDLTRVAIDHS